MVKLSPENEFSNEFLFFFSFFFFGGLYIRWDIGCLFEH